MDAALVWTAVGSCAGVVAAIAAIVPLVRRRPGAPRPAPAAVPAGTSAPAGALAPAGASGTAFVSYSPDDQAWSTSS